VLLELRSAVRSRARGLSPHWRALYLGVR